MARQSLEVGVPPAIQAPPAFVVSCHCRCGTPTQRAQKTAAKGEAATLAKMDRGLGPSSIALLENRLECTLGLFAFSLAASLDQGDQAFVCLGRYWV